MTHWLVNAAVRAGIPGAKALNLAHGIPVGAAWEQVGKELRVSEKVLVSQLAPVLRLPPANLDHVEAKAARLLPEKLARKHMVFALRETDRELVVASSDPQDYEAERDLGFASGRRIKFELAGPASIEAALQGGYSADSIVQNLLNSSDSTLADAVRFVEEEAPEAVAVQDQLVRGHAGLLVVRGRDDVVHLAGEAYDVRHCLTSTRSALTSSTADRSNRYRLRLTSFTTSGTERSTRP